MLGRPKSPSEPTSNPVAPPSPLAAGSALYGHVYAAAQDVQRISGLATMAEDADRVLRVLANLLEIARAAGSPAHDLAEINAWRVEAERRVEALRRPRVTVEVDPRIVKGRALSDGDIEPVS